MPFIEIKNLKVSYQNNMQEIVALSDVNASFSIGKITAIVGPSGCGKTTLIRTICGFLDYEGTILFCGENYASMNYKKRNISYVDQSITLNPHIDVYNNVASPLIINKVSRLEIDSRVKKILTDLGIRKCLSLFPSQLSIGQSQLVLLAKAIIKKPDLILLDEPFSNLDFLSKKRFCDVIKKQQEEQRATILFITHNYEDILELADYVAVMSKGKINTVIAINDKNISHLKEIMETNSSH